MTSQNTCNFTENPVEMQVETIATSTGVRKIIRRNIGVAAGGEVTPVIAPAQEAATLTSTGRKIIKKPAATGAAKKNLASAVPAVPALKKYKHYKKVGQKYDTPLKTDPLYRFYTSLHKQKPSSEMAIKWCIEHGVFMPKKAEALLLAAEMQKLKVK